MVSGTSSDTQSAGSRSNSLSSESSNQRSSEARTNDTAAVGAVASAQASIAACGDDLARTAASGKPVAAGEALRTLDEQTGSRQATDAKIEDARTGFAGSHGALNGGMTNLGKVSEAGASYGHGMRGGIGGVNATGSGLFSASEKGAGISADIGLSAGPVSATRGIERQQYTDGSRFAADSTYVGATLGQGTPATATMSYQARDMCAIGANPDGTVSYSFTGETRASVSAAADVRRASVAGSMFGGTRSQHTVTLPADADVRAVDPTRPDTWPNGTRVKMDDVAFQGGTLGGKYGIAEVELGRQTREGHSIVAERVSEGTIRASSGPTRGYTADGKVKTPDVLGFSAEVSIKHVNDVREHRQFDVDPRTPAGLAAFQNAITGQAMPSAATPGVTNMAHVTVFERGSADTAKVTSLVNDLEFENRHDVTRTITQTDSGVRTDVHSIDSDGDGTPEAVRTATQVGGMREPAIEYRVSSPVTADDDLAAVRQSFGSPDVKVGDRIELTLDSAQMEQVRLRDRVHARDSRYGVDPQQRRDAMAVSLAYSRDVASLFRSVTDGNMLRHAVNRQPNLDTVPGTVTVHPAPTKAE